MKVTGKETKKIASKGENSSWSFAPGDAIVPGIGGVRRACKELQVNLQRSILIVDDHEPIRFALKEYFTSHDFVVDCSDNLQNAEMLLAANRYAAIIMDLRLTGIDDTKGLDLITYARDRWPDICIILLTAYGSSQIEAEARRRGVDAFLDKPQSLSELERTVRALLASREAVPSRNKFGRDE